jgi:sialate O-acetylesterase
VWKPAMAHVVGQSVVVYANGVIKPVAARYGWSEVPEVSLYNESGLPASPFQTRKPKPVE